MGAQKIVSDLEGQGQAEERAASKETARLQDKEQVAKENVMSTENVKESIRRERDAVLEQIEKVNEQLTSLASGRRDVENLQALAEQKLDLVSHSRADAESQVESANKATAGARKAAGAAA